MKTWRVLVISPGAQCFFDLIEADYVRQDNGHLILKRMVPGSYPDIVKMYAPGRWLAVEIAAPKETER